MQKTILVTGSTDGIGLETARTLTEQGHNVIVHGRSPAKVRKAVDIVAQISGRDHIESHVADLSVFSEVKQLASDVLAANENLDVVINNAGVYRTPIASTYDGLDLRFMVNTIAPYLLTTLLLPVLTTKSRVINVSSAAQSPVELGAMAGRIPLSTSMAYAQSKLALTMWSRHLAYVLKNNGPDIIVVNPKSLLGSNMVKEAFGIAGADVTIGSDILSRAALSDEFADASGKYFDNDIGRFGPPHRDALDAKKCEAVIVETERIIASLENQTGRRQKTA